MRLVIDLQGAQTSSRFRGIGRYTESLVAEIVSLGKAHDIILVLNDAFPDTIIPIRRAFEPFVGKENIRVWTGPREIVGRNNDTLRRRRHAEAIYESFLASLQPDVLLITSLFEGREDGFAATVKSTKFDIPTAIICYDFIPMHYPEVYLKTDPAWHDLYMERLAQLSRADLVLAISEHTAQDADNWLSTGPREIKNISAGCAEIFSPIGFASERRAILRNRLHLKDDYIITSGGAEEHKNLRSLFAAHATLPADIQETYDLVVIGDHRQDTVDRLRQLAKDAGMRRDALLFSGYLSNEDLVTLYNDARLMVFPSLDEGFGLPPLEAMSCGTPTIAARAASLPEVVGIDEAMFDPTDAHALARHMEQALLDTPLRAILIENAQQQAKRFSWQKSGKLALQAMEELAARKQRDPLVSALDPLQVCLQTIAVNPPVAKEIDDLARTLALVFPNSNSKRRLFVDISELAVRDARTGCQRVTRSVLLEWVMKPPQDVEVVPVYAKKDFSTFFHAREYVAKIKGAVADGPDLPIDFAAGDIFFGLDLHAHISELQASYLSQMQRMGVRVQFLVYDLLPIEMPDYFVKGTKEAFEVWLDIITRYDGIIGISQASADAVKDWRAENRPAADDDGFEYHAVHLGADIASSAPTAGMPADADDVLTAMMARPCFLMTGTLEPRKGQAHVLDAFDLLWAQGQDVSLVIVGKKGWRIDEFADRLVKHPEMGTRLFWLEGISDEYLLKVYEKATCLIAASWGEGFGLPLIEAAHHGIPIIARDLPVFREVAKDHAFYFDSQTPTGLAASITEWLEMYSSGDAPQSKGMPVLTWAETARMMLDILLKRPMPLA